MLRSLPYVGVTPGSQRLARSRYRNRASLGTLGRGPDGASKRIQLKIVSSAREYDFTYAA